MESTYRYSANKTDGKFYGAVYAGTEQIATIDGIRTERGCKSFAKAAASTHRKSVKPASKHAVSHTLYGTVEL